MLTSILFIATSISAQQTINIDVVVNAKDANTTYGLNTYIQNTLQLVNNRNGCVQYNIISDRKSGQSPYIIELWESEEHAVTEIFKETRTTTKTVNEKKVSNDYTAAGIVVKSNINVFGRLIEKESTSILDLFVVEGNLRHETADEDIKNNYARADKDFKDNKLKDYADQIESHKQNIRNEMKNKVFNGMNSMVVNHLVPPAEIVGTAKVDGDKVKEVKFESCYEQDWARFGNFYHGVYSKETIEGFNVYYKQGTVALHPKDNTILSVSDGKKEMLPLLKKGEKLYLGEAYAMESGTGSDNKISKPKNIAFEFRYEQDHRYSEDDRRYIEFIHQAYFLDRRDMRVIAYNALTESINHTLSRSIYNTEEPKIEALSAEEIMDGPSVNTSIVVNVSNAKPKPDSFKSKLFSTGDPADNDPDNRYIFLTSSYEDIEVGPNQIVAKQTPKGLNFNTTKPDFDKIFDAIVANEAEIIKMMETDKDKVKTVLIQSTFPLAKGDKFEVFISDQEESTSEDVASVKEEDETKATSSKRKSKSRSKSKKTKSKKQDKKSKKDKNKKQGEIKVETVLNRYLGIAEVKNGDKDLYLLINDQSPLVAKKNKGGFFSSGEFNTSLRIIHAKNSML